MGTITAVIQKIEGQLPDQTALVGERQVVKD